MGGEDANGPQVAAGPDGTATALWQQLGEFGEIVLAAIRTADGSWSPPTELTYRGDPARRPALAAGSDGTVAAAWERRVGAEDRVQSVVRFDPGGPNHCLNGFGIDLNLVFGVPEEIVFGSCTTVTARARWRPLTFWYMNTVFDQVPPEFVPAGATPLEDLVAKLKSVKVVIDGGTTRQRTTVFAPNKALRIDQTFADYNPYDAAYPMAATLPRMASLRAGAHTVQFIWTLSAQHCDGFDVTVDNCLASGDNSMGTRNFTVGGP
jgi:hypothetical protein